jgi:hypothetical protein
MISRDFFSVANNLGDSVAFNLESNIHSASETEIYRGGRRYRREAPRVFAVRLHDRE